MSEQEIIEGNKLIAEFMGLKPIDDTRYGAIYKSPSPFETGSSWELKYHKSWDWLMPVVERIEQNTPYKIRIEETECEIYSIVSDGFISHKKEVSYIDIGEKINSVYYTIVEFIKWYNQQKQIINERTGNN